MLTSFLSPNGVIPAGVTTRLLVFSRVRHNSDTPHLNVLQHSRKHFVVHTRDREKLPDCAWDPKVV